MRSWKMTFAFESSDTFALAFIYVDMHLLTSLYPFRSLSFLFELNVDMEAYISALPDYV